MFIAIMKIMAMVVVSLSFAYIEEKKSNKRFEGFRQLMDENGKPLNEWVPIDYAE